LYNASYASRAQHHRTATTARYTRCDGSLPSPLHLAIVRKVFLIMFPPAATWTRAVGLRGLIIIIIIIIIITMIIIRRRKRRPYLPASTPILGRAGRL